MAYSSEEIQAAVEKLVRAGIRKPTDTSGVRQVEVQFDDIREVAAGVFITYPEAPYSVLSLGSDRLNGECVSALVAADSLLQLLECTARRTYPITDLTTLADAENALVELETAMGARVGATADPTTLPAYLRFKDSSSKYLKHIGVNVKANGEIVETPNQARTEIPSSFSSLMDSYRSLDAKQQTLRAGLEDYTGMKLPAVVTQAVVQRARQLLAADRGELEGMTEDQRLEVAKDKTLNVLSAQAIVDAYVNGQQVTVSPSFTGQVRPYADTNHEAEPASVTGDVMGPYALLSYPVPKGDPPDARDNNILELTTEGVLTRVILPTCLVAFVLGSGRPQQNPDDPEGPKVFTFYKKGPDITNPFPPPDTYPNRGYAENFTGNEDKPETWYFPPDNNIMYVEQYIEGGATVRYTIDFMAGVPPTPFIPNPANPPPSNLPWVAYRVRWTLAEVVALIQAQLSSSYIQCVGEALGTDPLELTNVQIEGKNPTDCLLDRRVGIRIPSVIVAGTETNTGAQNPLGFVVGLEMMTKRMAAPQIVSWVEAMTSKTNPQLAAVPRVSALSHMRGWTNTAEKAGLILAKWTGTGSVTSSGSTITFVIPSGYPTFTSMGVVVGDRVAFPRQYVKNGPDYEPMTDEGALYQVMAVADLTLTATRLSGPVAETYLYRTLDIGLPEVLTQVQVYDVAEVYTAPNDGGYEILAIDPYSPFRVRIGLMLSQTQQTREAALGLELELSAGPASVAFASANLLTQSSISVAGSAQPLFFVEVPSARGRTEYVQMPTGGPRILKGDKLQFKESLSPLVAYELVVKNVEGRILTLGGTVPLDIVFEANGSVPPSVKVLSGNNASFSTFQLNLEAWDSQAPADADLFEANTNALLNPLLANRVPPLGKVTDAKNAIVTLKEKLETLSTELQTQIKPVIAPVNDLINTLTSKGCDRGVELLLQGRFSEFFGLDMDEMSYAGAMQKAAREVARNDLAQSKFGPSRIRRKVMSMQSDSDPDYDHSDSDALTSPPDMVSGLDLTSSPDRA